MPDLILDPDNQAGGAPARRLVDIGDGAHAELVAVAAVTTDLIVTAAMDLLAAADTGPVDVSVLRELHVYARVTTLTGGVSPSVAFVLEREETPNVWAEVYAPAALTGAGAFSRSIGAGLETAQSLGRRVRLRWTISGAPTAAVADVVIIGKS